jgi:hypothetical protein
VIDSDVGNFWQQTKNAGRSTTNVEDAHTWLGLNQFINEPFSSTWLS